MSDIVPQSTAVLAVQTWLNCKKCSTFLPVISGRRKFDHISDILIDLAWLPASDMITYFDLSLLHGILTYGKPDVLRSWLSYNHEHVRRKTRHSRCLALPRAKNNHGKRRFVYRAAQMYNQMAIRHSSLPMPLFKTRIRDAMHARRSDDRL